MDINGNAVNFEAGQQDEPTTPASDPGGFDYGALDTEEAVAASIAAQKIRGLVQTLTDSYLAIGAELIAVKERLGHGHFGAWLRAEFNWSDRTAERYMSASRRFSENPTRVSNLAMKVVFLL